MTIYAVNGKEPVAAWIPSLDTAGNGTTTLTDLVGSNHGTLTNMDAATDWVADTGAGGVRALDFDGVNDFVQTTFSHSATNTLTISLWAFLRSTALYRGLFMTRTGAVNGLHASSNVNAGNTFAYNWNDNINTYSWTGGPSVTLSAWTHLVIAVSATEGVLYKNGTGSTRSIANTAVSASSYVIGQDTFGGRFTNGRIDDIRVFLSTLNASDVAYLYNSGAGRGRVASSSTRKNNMLIGCGF